MGGLIENFQAEIKYNTASRTVPLKITLHCLPLTSRLIYDNRVIAIIDCTHVTASFFIVRVLSNIRSSTIIPVSIFFPLNPTPLPHASFS